MISFYKTLLKGHGKKSKCPSEEHHHGDEDKDEDVGDRLFGDEKADLDKNVLRGYSSSTSGASAPTATSPATSAPIPPSGIRPVTPPRPAGTSMAKALFTNKHGISSSPVSISHNSSCGMCGRLTKSITVCDSCQESVSSMDWHKSHLG